MAVQFSSCKCAMENHWVLLAGVVVGWLGREWAIIVPKKDEPNICHCQCHLPASSVNSNWGVSPYWIFGLAALVLLVVFGNTALALQVLYKDGATGTDRTVQVGVKGKSKGV